MAHVPGEKVGDAVEAGTRGSRATSPGAAGVVDTGSTQPSHLAQARRRDEATTSRLALARRQLHRSS